MNKTIVGFLVAVVVVGGGSFYGGMRYATSKAPVRQGSGQNFSNLSPEERQARFQQAGGAGGRRPAGRMGDTVVGEVLARDDKSLTIKSRDGGSKIVFFGSSVEVTKTVNGELTDVAAGSQVLVSGKTNGDGSLTAETIQIRPTPPPIPPSGN